MNEFKGKGVFITGAASGIGLGMARAFANAGAKVALADIESARLETAYKSIISTGAESIAIDLDVSDRNAVKTAADQTVEAFGKVHVVCNNAGVGSRIGLDVATADDWDWMLGVNLHGPINGLLAFLPLLQVHGEEAHILFTSSVSGLRVHPSRQQGIYNTAKFGLCAMAEALANDLSSTKIGVSVICPGFVKTELSKSERNRPNRYSETAFKPRGADDEMSVAAAAGAMDPEFFGKRIISAVRRGDFYILTDDREREIIEARFQTQREALDQVAVLNQSNTP